MHRYSKELKEAMVVKLCLPGGPSALQLSRETGISQTALSRWKRQFGSRTSLKERRPQDWSPEEKLQAVFEAQGLKDDELGAFLRRNGLHTTDLDNWKKEITVVVGAAKRGRGRPRKDPELVAAQEENKRLKRDLRRKEKALAEQTALVILQKKAQELWGKDEDDE